MPETGLQQAKSHRARKAICTATIDLLVELGYAETSLNRVAAQAGFSKGALQHHFPNKEDLIAATVDELLARTFKPPRTKPGSVGQVLTGFWTRFINTPAYRALMEYSVLRVQIRIYRNDYLLSSLSGARKWTSNPCKIL